MMDKVLVVMDAREEHRAVLRAAAPDAEFIFNSAKDIDPEILKTADAIIGNISPALLKNCERLRLLQLNSAGTDGYTTPGVLPENAVLCNATGAYGLAISEHMIGMLLCLMKKLDCYRMNQVTHAWKDMGTVKSIFGSGTLVVGLGDIGNEFAKRMHAMGSTVTGIRRNKAEIPDYVEAVYQLDSLYACLEQADIVAACLPGTAATSKLFNAEAFSHMKEGAFFINIGRGTAVDTDALADALASGHLAGAGVDVTDPEPLPADHKLWDAPNVLITPHVSGGYHLRATQDKIIGIAAANLRHAALGEPFENTVDMKTGYRKFKG